MVRTMVIFLALTSPLIDSCKSRTSQSNVKNEGSQPVADELVDAQIYQMAINRTAYLEATLPGALNYSEKKDPEKLKKEQKDFDEAAKNLVAIGSKAIPRLKVIANLVATPDSTQAEPAKTNGSSQTEEIIPATGSVSGSLKRPKSTVTNLIEATDSRVIDSAIDSLVQISLKAKNEGKNLEEMLSDQTVDDTIKFFKANLAGMYRFEEQKINAYYKRQFTLAIGKLKVGGCCQDSRRLCLVDTKSEAECTADLLNKRCELLNVASDSIFYDLGVACVIDSKNRIKPQ